MKYTQTTKCLILFVILGGGLAAAKQIARFIGDRQEPIIAQRMHIGGKIKEETETYAIDARYPVTGIDNIDASLKGVIDDAIEGFKENGAFVAPSEAWKNDLTITVEPFAFSDRYKSYRFDVSVYTGGAHPNFLYVTKTFDMQTGRELALRDLFKTSVNALKEVSTRSIAELKSRGEELGITDETLADGASPTNANYQDFVVTPTELIVYFEPYAVAPYAAGPQAVIIKLADIKDLLKPEFVK